MNAEGEQVGPYRIVKQIGEGGMGSVWIAEHTMLGRRAAIKLLHPECSARPELVMRFFNEARAATTINDPGIVQIFDFGKHVDGRVYIVMELLDGEPLDRRLASRGALEPGEAVRIIRQVASSLGAAHAHGIVHRDLKPENIFLARDPEVPGGERAKLLDFGIAKLANDKGAVKTSANALMGTPLYMSPEQCRGAGQVDQRTDVYSLGCVLFTLVTGRPPFQSEGTGELIMMHMTVPAPRASSRVGGIPPAIDDVIARCLAKSPDERYASGTELAQALGEAHGGSAFQMPTQPITNVHAIPALTTLSGGAGSIADSRRPKSRRGLVIGGVVAVVVAGGITAAVVAGGDGKSEPVAAAPAPKPEPPPPPVPKPADTLAITKQHVQLALGGFAGWAKTHADVACPPADELGGGDDGWGHPFMVTCTDQPGDQRIGVISSGPDGKPGTDDDIASWTLGADVVAIVRGARWQPTKAVATAKPPVVKPPVVKPAVVKQPPVIKKPSSGVPGDTDGDGIPDTR